MKKKPQIKKPVVSGRSKKTKYEPFLDVKNFYVLIGGTLVMGLGFILMIGGYNDDPSFFNEAGLYSTRRTVVSPIVLILGVIIIIWGIFKDFNPTKQSDKADVSA
ncbi:MAG: DUF3098 domain-containing protein [Chitinophagaceae bacterium]|nr:MAG: DUF3098 domain-containing protein [Chitinophagaceae bacterium]